ncbi:uncharacterized protein A4U43_C01F29150 [Asparagus officinalis]|uniref:Uncharacterized protein n=1 Tax=Asparagus officinalis TaxID=4686 RepID=A0A5P1FUV1_ASPOF|nr:uncharacterized protein A4U43_C01F29150 [Asparagus officinalis]
MEHPYDVIAELDWEVGRDTDVDDILELHSQEVTSEDTTEVSSKHKKKKQLSGDSDSFEIMREVAYVRSELFSNRAIGINRDLMDLFFTLGDDLENIWVRRYASGQFKIGNLG